MIRARALLVTLLLLFAAPYTTAQQEAVIAYRLSFPERAHRIMHVEATFSALPPGPLRLRMSRSSPGRYALHEFAKNVLDFTATDSAGRPLAVTRPDPYGWDVTAHDGTVRVSYRVFGDRVDGTYLGIDSTHAHINMPAALIWARGLEQRPASVRFERPSGTSWRVATQLLPGRDEMSFTAPSLSYLMDSPTEVGDFALETFTVRAGNETVTIRLAVHHDGTPQELAAFRADVERIVRESRTIYDDFPDFDTPGSTYTFIADYLPWANGDGMEHRNSTILTSPSSLRSNRLGLLDTVSHEFLHAWNVERIRPRSLEPFNLDGANLSGELWFGEGFTSYYGPLVLRRAGLTSVADFVGEMSDAINAVTVSPGHRVRSLREMSELATLVDGANATDRTTFEHTYISYYTWGSIAGLALDLDLRARSGGKVTLDHFMRAMWQRHGVPGGRRVGDVDVPYSPDDLVTALAAVSGDPAFARDFFARYVNGRELPDYQRLLAPAGIVLRKVAAGAAWAGPLRLADGATGVRVAGATAAGTPVYEAGLDRDDVLVSINGARIANAADWERTIQGRRPGDDVSITFRRRGTQVTATMKLVEDPRVRAMLIEDTGGQPTAAQRAFRDAWLNPSRNAF